MKADPASTRTARGYVNGPLGKLTKPLGGMLKTSPRATFANSSPDAALTTENPNTTRPTVAGSGVHP
jgi:hypothetical protein